VTAASPGPVDEPAELSWGRHYLMCPPQHFGVLYEINPWMHRSVSVEPDTARAQWDGLVATLRSAGAEVVVMEPQPDVPDLVFTANAGLVNGGQFVPSHFRHPERQPETEIDATWFAARGWRVDRLPEPLDHEGAGDALPFTGTGSSAGAGTGGGTGGGPNGRTVLLSGYSFRSDATAATELSALLGCPVRSIQLVDPRLYHVDLTFCPLDSRRAIVAPLGWDAYGRKVVEALVPEPLVLTDDEALSFCANSVVVDRTVVMPHTPPRVGRQLESWGFTVVECRVDEFLKAGGGCRCLTLALDVTLSSDAPPAPVP
jgi:N-dimethylarginine dimethylaminohydrolase